MNKKSLWVWIGASVFSIAALSAQVQVIPPAKQYPTAIAIITDADTYSGSKDALIAYKNIIEKKEHLSAYIITGQWQSPDEVKKYILQLKNQKTVLEGVVLVGNIPVVLVRNAQHMTTSFKMDEKKFSFEQTSAASDRFYDDFDLNFRFIKKDEKHPLWYYYELDASSPQIIQSDIYSSRILSHKTGAEATKEISAFLWKAVRVHEEAGNPLDNVVAYTGSDYNSESLTSWNNEYTAMKELFPVAFSNALTHQFLNFRMNNEMKFRLFTALQRPELDLAILSEHGDVRKQYINDVPSGNNLNYSYENVRMYMREAQRIAKLRKQDSQSTLAYYGEKYGIPAGWFETNDSLRLADSLKKANTEIVTKEVEQLNPQAKVIIFNACYNGSFQLPGNIASAYIFDKGNTVVAHGNTLNVLQDKWTIELTGLLQQGYRVGTWACLTNTLETHLVGDPTYRFSAVPASSPDDPFALHAADIKYWQKILTVTHDPVQQQLAMVMLYRNEDKTLAAKLPAIYKTSVSPNVRMECINLLFRLQPSQFAAMAVQALTDPYELIRRKTAEWLCLAGDNQFIRPLITLAVEKPDDERVLFSIHKTIGVMNWDSTTTALQEAKEKYRSQADINALLDKWISEIEAAKSTAHKALELIQNSNMTTARRILAVRTLRNYPYHLFVPQLLAIAEKQEEDESLRQNILEALGWFSLSYQKESILSACRKINSNPATPIAVQKEATQTSLRLTRWALH